MLRKCETQSISHESSFQNSLGAKKNDTKITRSIQWLILIDAAPHSYTHTHAQTHGSAKTLRRKMNPKNNKRSKTYNFH